MLARLVCLDGSEAHRRVGDLLDERSRAAEGATADRDTADVQTARVGGQVPDLAVLMVDQHEAGVDVDRGQVSQLGRGVKCPVCIPL